MRQAVMVLVLSTFAVLHAAAQVVPEPWKILPGVTASELKSTHRAALVSSDALSWPDGRSALITYWRGGPSDTYYRCIDYMDADFRATGHSCWELVEG